MAKTIIFSTTPTDAEAITPWATIARDRHVPIPVISEGLGHDSDKTTLIYLASIDRGEVDDANRMILEML